MTVTAAVTNDKNSAGVTWTLSGPGALSNKTTTSATYTAPAATNAQQTATITATSVANTAESGTATITIPAMPAVTSTSTNLAGAVGTPYSVTLQASGGIPPYTWALANGTTLPSCLTLKSNGTLTTTSGTAPTASCAGTYSNLIFTVTDSGKPTPLTESSAPLSITITAPTLTFAPVLPAGAVGTAYVGSVAATGALGTTTYSLASGTLPADLSLNTSTGAITGTPKASDVGTYNFTVTIVDAYGDTATSGPLSIAISAAPAITFTGTVPSTGTYGVAFSGSAAATGGAGALTYTISAGALPPDLTLDASNGSIAGTPDKASDVGSFNFTVQAADAYGDSATQSYSLTISYPVMSVTTSTLPAGYVGGTYTQTSLAATGGTGVSTNYSWQLTGGTSLPGGLSLSTAGVISGTLLNSDTAGTVNFTVQVTDTVAKISGTANLSIDVKPGVSITTATTLPTGYVGSNYSQQLAATGGSGTGYTWSVNSGSTLPGGLTLSAGGLLSGSPTTAGSPTFNLTVTDSLGNTASATFSLTISPGVSVTPPTLTPAYPGVLYTSAAFSAMGGSGTGYTWSWAAASGSTLPSGLSINSSTGVISGTPVNSGTSSVVSSVVVTAKDSVGNTGSVTVSITVEATLAVTTPTTLPAGTVSVAYSQTLAASGGSGTGYSWTTDAAGTTSLTSVGLSLGTNGTVSGSSPTLGTATFTATVSDSEGHTGSATFTVTINNQLKINQTTLPAGNAGSSYSQTLTASGGSGSGYTFSATNSNLSTFGLTLAADGSITGTPSQSGTVSFTANVKDSANNTATQALTITVYSALLLPAPNPSSLPSGYTNVAYSGSVAGSGGSGSLSIAVTTALTPANGTLATGVSGATVNVSGTPTTATLESFGVTLTDTKTSNTISQAYTIDVTTPTPVTLPSPNPSSLPAATVNQAYTGSISVSGGVPPYTWSVNGTSIPTNGSQVAISNGIYVSNDGSGVLSVGGTPTSATTVDLTNVKVTDAASSSATQSYTIAVSSTFTVSGQISLTHNCGGTSPNLSIFTVTITNGSNFTQQTTTDSSGNYTFSGVPNGTYTITPSLTTSGPSVVFYPAAQQNVTVNNVDVYGESFAVALGYTVSGTANYSGTTTSGRLYLLLVNTSCGGPGGNGTSIAYPFTSGGSFSIRGVPPGNYTLLAYIDPTAPIDLGEGAPNTADPSNGTGTSVSVSTANVTGVSVALADPGSLSISNAPKLKAVAPQNSGAIISFGNISNSNGIENYTSYTVQWSTTTSGFSSSNQATFKAVGTGSQVWILRSGNANFVGALANGTAYYFRAMGTNPTGNSPWGYWDGSGTSCTSTTCAATVTIGAPTTGDTVSGTIIIPSSVTPNPGAVLYAGLYDQNTNTAYADIITSPTNASGGNSFTVNVPASPSGQANYVLFGILDQNNDGLIDAGDVTNVNNGSGNTTISITGPTSGLSKTLPSSNAGYAVQTQYQSFTSNGGTSTGYALIFNIEEGNKLPVAVTLTGGPNVINPVDISNYCEGCGHLQFQDYFNINNDTPSVGDTYSFNVTYSDGTSETVTAKVTGWDGGTSVVGVGGAGVATNLAPTGTSSTSVTPNFTWTFPANPSDFTYQFGISGTNLSWQVPGSNSNLKGFTYAETSGGSGTTGTITWGIDPTGDTSNNLPSGDQLTTNTQYDWYITAQDSNGNQAQVWTTYTP